MTRDTAAELARIVAEDGPWTSHWFDLGGGLQTLPSPSTWSADRAALALRCASLALGKPPARLRALDLGCLEGGLTIALAQAGCTAVGLDVRPQHLRKARFVAEVLEVPGARFVEGDMLRLDEHALGTFDLVVCAGTLYHVDAPDLVPFLSSLDRACSGVLVVDTHVSVEPREAYDVRGGLAGLGQSIVEHVPLAGERKDDKLWASADNDFAFWPTERTLANLLLEAGFAQVSRVLAPVPEWEWQDRGYWVACSSAHARAVGLPPGPTSRLADPDPRPARCPMIGERRHLLARNPATRPLA